MDDFITLITDVWNRGFFGIDLGSIISSLLVILLALLFRGFIISVVIKALAKLADKTESNLDDEILNALRRPLGLIPITIALYICTLILPLSGVVGEIATNTVKAFVVFTIFSALANSIKPIFEALSTSSWLTVAIQMWLERASKFVVWVIGVAVILDIFGIQIGPLIAGLGLFSVAVALGAQDLFKNLISGILVLVERRFQVGDWIFVEDVIEGTVESIGFRSTVVRRFDKSLATIPNFQFAEKAVINNSQITNRRINWIIGLEYRTTSKQLSDIKKEIEEYIKKSEHFTTSENTILSVKIDQFAASSIDIKLICFTKTKHYLEWMKVKDILAIEIKNIVEKHKASFAFPSTSIYVEKN
jgi:MscS family membrane protein